MSKPMQYEYEREISADIKDNNEMSENTDLNSKYESEQSRYLDQDHDKEEEENNIIPWKKLLRKTNSRLTAT